jgi:hypothetical protein
MKFFTPITLVIIGASVALGADAVHEVSYFRYRRNRAAKWYIELISFEMLVLIIF